MCSFCHDPDIYKDQGKYELSLTQVFVIAKTKLWKCGRDDYAVGSMGLLLEQCGSAGRSKETYSTAAPTGYCWGWTPSQGPLILPGAPSLHVSLPAFFPHLDSSPSPHPSPPLLTLTEMTSLAPLLLSSKQVADPSRAGRSPRAVVTEGP